MKDAIWYDCETCEVKAPKACHWETDMGHPKYHHARMVAAMNDPSDSVPIEKQAEELGVMLGLPRHNHPTRDIKKLGAGCSACDVYHARAELRAAKDKK